MQVRLNGKDTEIKDGSTIHELVDSRRQLDRVLVELNGSLVGAEQWWQVQLKPGDKIELIWIAMGG